MDLISTIYGIIKPSERRYYIISKNDLGSGQNLFIRLLQEIKCAEMEYKSLKLIGLSSLQTNITQAFEVTKVTM